MCTSEIAERGGGVELVGSASSCEGEGGGDIYMYMESCACIVIGAVDRSAV